VAALHEALDCGVGVPEVIALDVEMPVVRRSGCASGDACITWHGATENAATESRYHALLRLMMWAVAGMCVFHYRVKRVTQASFQRALKALMQH